MHPWQASLTAHPSAALAVYVSSLSHSFCYFWAERYAVFSGNCKATACSVSFRSYQLHASCSPINRQLTNNSFANFSEIVLQQQHKKMAPPQRMRVANEKASKYVTMRGNVPKSSVSFA